jgi:hypothetical protein
VAAVSYPGEAVKEEEPCHWSASSI